MINKISVIFAIMFAAMTIVFPVSASFFAITAPQSIPSFLKLTIESSNIIVGEKTYITINILDQNDKPAVSGIDRLLNISTSLGYAPSNIVIPAGTHYSVLEFYSNVPGVAIISVESKNLIGDTGSIAVIPAITPLAKDTIKISSIPPGAGIYLDGSYKGKTPKVINDVPQGNHLIELRLDGFYHWSNNFYMMGGDTLNLTAILSKKGGGGGGIITREPVENILLFQTVGGSLMANVFVPINFSMNREGGIYEILIKGEVNESEILVRVELLKNTSRIVRESPPGIVYKNVNIWTGSEMIKEGRIRFKVETSWMSENDLGSSDIKMLRWDGNKWMKLETSEIKSDSSFTYFETATEGFLQFAISGFLLESVITETATITPGLTVVPPIEIMEPSTISLLVYVLILFIIVGMYIFFEIR